MRRSVAAAIGLIALAVCAAASAKTYPTKIAAADQARARVAVLRLGELPGSGWSGGQVQPDLNLFECPGYHPRISDLLVTGAAESSFRRSGGLFSSEVVMFRNATMARLDEQRGRTGEESCLRRTLADQAAQNGSKLVSFALLPFPRVAPTTRAYRGILSIQGQRVAFDVVSMRHGRVEMLLGGVAPSAAAGDLRSAEIRLARLLAARAGS